ncbi:hypothetical protein KIH74_25335 [Kineosporia sp. J2-2]|uniref:Uncharacterized protein n=1 Tax=Kineosporia corallincola TaxID=2835133 RepID=A0ABS5TMG7_9ACTN|nr:hypothetical protein [Kineosporia corallincola]MBT0772294.1 hypothetical protein [Kineosporia corallincola]
MDPLTASALTTTLTAVLGSAAGEAGKSAWATLTDATRRLLGREAPAAQALEAAGDEPLPRTIDLAVGTVLQAAADHPDFAAELLRWHESTTQDVRIATSGGVNNSVSGDARVDRLIQAHTVGDITFN